MSAFRLCENKILGAGTYELACRAGTYKLACRAGTYKLACRGLCLLLLIAAVACGRQAPPPPSEPIEPPAPAMVEHTVQYRGETLGLIARWYTGKSSNWQEIVAANPGLRPERINIGDQIMIPASLVVNDQPLPSTAVRRGSASTSTAEATEDTTTPVVGDSAAMAEDASAPQDFPVGDAPAIEDPVIDEAVVEAPELDSADEDLSVDALLGEIAAEREESENVVEDPVPAAAEVIEEVSPEPVADAPPSETVDSDEDELERERLLDELLSQ